MWEFNKNGENMIRHVPYQACAQYKWMDHLWDLDTHEHQMFEMQAELLLKLEAEDPPADVSGSSFFKSFIYAEFLTLS